MVRKSFCAFAVLSIAMLNGAVTEAAILTSNRVQVTHTGNPLYFDFNSTTPASEWADFNDNSYVVGMQVFWEFQSLNPSSDPDVLAETTTMRQGLLVPSVPIEDQNGIPFGVNKTFSLYGNDVDDQLKAGWNTATSEYTTAEGKQPFSDLVLDELRNGPQGFGIISAVLGDGLKADRDLINEYLNGLDSDEDGILDKQPAGQIFATMRIWTLGEGDGPPNNVPEPASILVWGALGLGVMARRRLALAKS